LQSLSQNISIKEPRVKTSANNSDTLILIKLFDAKIILADVLEREILDSLVTAYQVSDSLKDVAIELHNNKFKASEAKCNNQVKIIDNMNSIIVNNGEEIGILNDTIEKQKKEIKKQKFLKIIGFAAAIVIPITMLIL